MTKALCQSKRQRTAFRTTKILLFIEISPKVCNYFYYYVEYSVVIWDFFVILHTYQ